METTKRKNGKWAKISGKRGRWWCAFGWEGSIQCTRKMLCPTKDYALTAANYWLND